jgi:hypothetical protein
MLLLYVSAVHYTAIQVNAMNAARVIGKFESAVDGEGAAIDMDVTVAALTHVESAGAMKTASVKLNRGIGAVQGRILAAGNTCAAFNYIPTANRHCTTVFGAYDSDGLSRCTRALGAYLIDQTHQQNNDDTKQQFSTHATPPLKHVSPVFITNYNNDTLIHALFV